MEKSVHFFESQKSASVYWFDYHMLLTMCNGCWAKEKKPTNLQSDPIKYYLMPTLVVMKIRMKLFVFSVIYIASSLYMFINPFEPISPYVATNVGHHFLQLWERNIFIY